MLNITLELTFQIHIDRIYNINKIICIRFMIVSDYLLLTGFAENLFFLQKTLHSETDLQARMNLNSLKSFHNKFRDISKCRAKLYGLRIFYMFIFFPKKMRNKTSESFWINENQLSHSTWDHPLIQKFVINIFIY